MRLLTSYMFLSIDQACSIWLNSVNRPLSFDLRRSSEVSLPWEQGLDLRAAWRSLCPKELRMIPIGKRAWKLRAA